MSYDLRPLSLLVIAGIIEGFISPVRIEPGVKFVIGASMLVLLALYLFGAGTTRASSSALSGSPRPAPRDPAGRR